MNYKLLFTATVCAAAFCAAPVHADYTSWQDPNYDFRRSVAFMWGASI